MLNYRQTLDYLFKKLPMYQQKGSIAYKADIKRISEASNAINNPQKKFKSIHIAGTNGKGSTAHMLGSILQESGYKTGIYSSPHLKDFRERIKINGKLISQDQVVDFVEKNQKLFEEFHLSFFEMTVLLAFEYFSKKEVDIAIIETGLGGRLDSTNIIYPEISIITNISFDHTNLLGNTLEEIANEKAGIIKEKTPVIIGKRQHSTDPIFIQRAKKLNSKIIFASCEKKFHSDLQGAYQQENINTTISTIKELQKLNWRIQKKHIEKGLKKVVINTSFLGRWQTLSENPLTICDIAHNEESIIQVVSEINKICCKDLHIVFGIVKEKNTENILSLLPKEARYYFCHANISRSLNATKLKEKAKAIKLTGNAFESVDDALKEAKKMAKKEDFIFIGGSTFVVAEAL